MEQTHILYMLIAPIMILTLNPSLYLLYDRVEHMYKIFHEFHQMLNVVNRYRDRKLQMEAQYENRI